MHARTPLRRSLSKQNAFRNFGRQCGARARLLALFACAASALSPGVGAEEIADPVYSSLNYSIEQHRQYREGRASDLQAELERLLSDDHGFGDEVELRELEISGTRKELAHHQHELADLRASYLAFQEFLVDAIDALSQAGASEALAGAVEALHSGEIAVADRILEKACEGEVLPRFVAAEAYFQRGRISDALGDYRLAFSHYERAVALLPTNRRYLERAGTLACAMGHFAKAVQWAEEGLALPSGSSEIEQGIQVDLLTSLGAAYDQRADYERALSALQLALSAAEAKYGADSTQASICHFQLGAVYSSLGKHSDAIRHFELRLKQLRSPEPSLHSRITTTLCYLAQSQLRLGNYEAAGPYLDEIAALLESVEASDNPQDAAMIAWSLGFLHATAGRYMKAEASYRKALEGHRIAYGADHPYIAKLNNDLAAVNIELSHFDVALEQAQAAHTLYEINYGPDHPKLAESLKALSDCYRGLNDFPKSMKCARESLRITRDALGADHPSMIRALYQYGSLKHELGQCDEAMAILQRSIDRATTLYGPNHYSVGSAQGAMAACLKDRGDIAGSITLYRAALENRIRAHSPHHMAVAITQMNLSWALMKSEDFRGALALLEQARATVDKSIGPGSEDMVVIYGGMAECWLAMGDNKEAAKCFELAAASSSLALGPNDPSVATVWGLAGFTAMDAEDYSKALRCFEAARDQLLRAYGPKHPELARMGKMIEFCRSALE